MPFAAKVVEILTSSVAQTQENFTRLSMEGKPLYYYAIAGRKKTDIPPDFLSQFG